MKNILVIGKYYSPFRGGIEANTAQVCESLASEGHKVTALVNNHEKGERSDIVNGVKVLRRNVLFNIKGQPISLSLFKGVAIEDYDLIHFHAPNPFANAELALRLMTARRRPPVVITHHMEIFGRNLLRVLTLPLYRYLVAASEAVIVTSQKNAAISRDLPPSTKAVAIPLGIALTDYIVSDEQRYEAFAWRRSLVGDAPVVCFVGRHARYKGLHVLVEAIAALDGVHVLIAGTGSLRDELEALAEKRGANERVHFLGEVSMADKLKLLACSDVFAFPSTEITEAFGISQLEAMAVGTPVVATNLPTGVTDVSIDGETALLARVGDATDLAEKIKRLLDDRGLAASLAERAKHHVTESFAADVVTIKARNLLHSMATGRTAA